MEERIPERIAMPMVPSMKCQCRFVSVFETSG